MEVLYIKKNIILAIAILLFGGCSSEYNSVIKDNTLSTQTSIKTDIIDETKNINDKYEFIENDISLSYKTGVIIYNEYLKFKNGEYTDWWIDNETSPHLCVCAAIMDLNCDGEYELFLKKYKNSIYCYNTLFDINSGEILYNSNDDLTTIYYDNSMYHIKTEQAGFRKILISRDNNSKKNNYEQVNSNYLYISNSVNSTIYEYKKSDLHPYVSGSWCRKYDYLNGFTYYYGEYVDQLEELLFDFENQIEKFVELGELEHLAISGQTFDNLYVVQISQIEIQDFNSLIFSLEPVDSLVM